MTNATSDAGLRPRAERLLPPHGWAVALAFAAVVVCFAASTLYVDRQLRGVLTRASEITQDTMPSIAQLSVLRARLRVLDHALADAVDGQTWSRRAIDATLADVAQEFEAYTRVPSSPDEREAWSSASVPLERTRSYAWSTMALLDSGDGASARAVFDTQLRPELDRADQALLRLVEINTRQALTAAAQVATARRRAQLFGLTLDATCVVVAVALAALAFRAVRRHDRWLELRANELDQFAARVAHDIQGPLAPAADALARAVAETPREAPLHEAAERGLRSLEHVRSIVDDLLAFARHGAGVGGAAPVGVITASVVDELRPNAAADGVALTLEPSDATLTVACAPGVLASVLSNLIRSAVRSMGGAVERRVEVRSRDLGDLVCIAVSDTGPGLPADVEDALAGAQPAGHAKLGPPLGLGLATVKRLVEAHGGAIGADTAPGRGTTIWLELPKARTVAQAPSAAEVLAPAAVGRPIRA